MSRKVTVCENIKSWIKTLPLKNPQWQRKGNTYTLTARDDKRWSDHAPPHDHIRGMTYSVGQHPKIDDLCGRPTPCQHE